MNARQDDDEGDGDGFGGPGRGRVAGDGGGVGAEGQRGESDRRGERPKTSPISPLMVGTTICELAGVDTQTRAEMSVLEGGRVIDELLSV